MFGAGSTWLATKSQKTKPRKLVIISICAVIKKWLYSFQEVIQAIQTRKLVRRSSLRQSGQHLVLPVSLPYKKSKHCSQPAMDRQHLVYATGG